MDYLCFEKVKYRNIFDQRRKWYLVPRVSFLRKLGWGGGGGVTITIIWIPRIPVL